MSIAKMIFIIYLRRGKPKKERYVNECNSDKSKKEKGK